MKVKMKVDRHQKELKKFKTQSKRILKKGLRRKMRGGAATCVRVKHQYWTSNFPTKLYPPQ